MAVPDFIFYSLAQATVTNGPLTFFSESNSRYGNTLTAISFDVNNAGETHTYEFSSGGGLSQGWLFIYIGGPGNTNHTDNVPYFTLSNGSQELLRLFAIDENAQFFQYWNGSAWVDMHATAVVMDDFPLDRVDVFWNLNATGEFTFWLNGAMIGQFTGDTLFTPSTVIDRITIHSANDTTYSPIVVDSSDTRNLMWDYQTPTSDGFYTEWSAGETALDDGHSQMARATEDFSVGSAVGQRITLNYPSFESEHAALTVETVFIFIGGKAQSDPGFYLKPFLRKDATDYSLTAPSHQFTAARVFGGALRIDNNPETGLPWASPAEVEAFELGVIVSDTE